MKMEGKEQEGILKHELDKAIMQLKMPEKELDRKPESPTKIINTLQECIDFIKFLQSKKTEGLEDEEIRKAIDGVNRDQIKLPVPHSRPYFANPVTQGDETKKVLRMILI